MTSKQTIRAWLEEGKRKGASHVLIAWDTFDGPHGDYPIYVPPSEDVNVRIDACQRSADRLIEVYNLSLDLENQLNERRAWHV